MKYDKKQDSSYAVGMFATIELLKYQLDNVVGVYYSDKIKMNANVQRVFELCKQHHIPVTERTKFVESIAGKENVFLLGEFKKYQTDIQPGNHLVLVNPSDMGNLGTIFRTCLGFGVKNIAIIKPCVDIFDPKVIRASQGAFFKLNVQLFDTFDDYNHIFSQNTKYMFCLDGDTILQNMHTSQRPFSLVFGNEASGLPNSMLALGNKVKIKQSSDIDSFNLAVSVAVALYQFTK